MSRWRRFASSLVLSSACTPTPSPQPAPEVALDIAALDVTTLETELVAAHRATLQNHLDGDWRALTATASDPSRNVSRGKVHSATRAELEARFQAYFAAATFTRYEDLQTPIARVSADGSLGWVIAQVRVEGRYDDGNGASEPLDTTWGWIELYQRVDQTWQRIGTVSNHDAGPEGFAEPLGTPEEPVRQTLAAAQRALGGREALSAIRTLDTIAAVTTPRGPVTTQVLAASDGRVRFEQRSSTGTRVIIALADGVWAGSQEKITPASPSDRVFAVGHALHLILMSPTRLYTRAQARGEARFSGRSARVLEFTDALGNPVRIYYDTDTDLPLGLKVIEPESRPPEPIIIEVDDWRPHGTTRAFHHAVFKHRGNEFIYDYKEIRFNDADPSLLRRPPSSAIDQKSTPEATGQ